MIELCALNVWEYCIGDYQQPTELLPANHSPDWATLTTEHLLPLPLPCFPMPYSFEASEMNTRHSPVTQGSKFSANDVHCFVAWKATGLEIAERYT